MMMKQSSKTRHSGFTFIELVIVIVLLGLLAAAAIPRLLDVTDDAQIATLEGVAGGFSTAATITRVQWAADGGTRGSSTTAADKVAVNLDGTTIYVTENGWPSNTDSGSDSSEDSQTAAECQQVWNGILQSAPSSTTNSNDRANAKFFISVIDQNPDLCRYELIINSDPAATQTHYFDYALDDGQVTVFKPSQR